MFRTPSQDFFQSLENTPDRNCSSPFAEVIKLLNIFQIPSKTVRKVLPIDERTGATAGIIPILVYPFLCTAVAFSGQSWKSFQNMYSKVFLLLVIVVCLTFFHPLFYLKRSKTSASIVCLPTYCFANFIALGSISALPFPALTSGLLLRNFCTASFCAFTFVSLISIAMFS